MVLIKKNEELINQIENSIELLEFWITENGWEGWDPFDTQMSFCNKNLILKNKSIGYLNKLLFRITNKRMPKQIRKIKRVKKQINPKAMGLILSAYCKLFTIYNDSLYLTKAKEIAGWLIKNSNTAYKDYCWGYPFDWLSKIFIPKGTPSSVVTSHIGHGFWDLYQITKEKEYLEICISICNFFVNSLNRATTEKGVCFSYTPLDDFQVHNANLFVAEFLNRIGTLTNEKNWLDLAKEAVNFTLSEQNDDGSICYWSENQKEKYKIKCTRDHYHSGFEIRMLYLIWKTTNLDSIKKAVDSYYKFYLDNFFAEDYAPILEPKGDYTVDIHSCAEALLCNSLLINENLKSKEVLMNTINWSTTNMQKQEGWFIYRFFKNKNKVRKIEIPYFRWGQAWMILGLSKALEVLKL